MGIVGETIFVIVLAGVNGLLDFFSLLLFLLAQLQVEPLLFLRLLHFGGESAPREFNGDGGLVDDLVVLVAEERDGGWRLKPH